MDGDIALVDTEKFGGSFLGSSSVLSRGPYLAAATFEPDRDVHWLHRRVGEKGKFVHALDAFSSRDGVGIESGVGGVPILLSVEPCAKLYGKRLGRLVVVLPGLPFDGQRFATLDGGPCVLGDDGNLACIFVGRVRTNGDIEDLEYPRNRFGSVSVEADNIAAQVGTLGDYRVDHAGDPNIEPKPCRPLPCRVCPSVELSRRAG